jgi:hypothetical protein
MIRLVVLLIAVINGSELAIAENASALQGWGTVTCGAFASMYKDDPKFAEDHLFDWAQGMMSGMNVHSLLGGEGSKDLSFQPADKQRSALRAFCDRRPLANFYEAVMDLYLSMPLVAHPTK